MDTIWSLLELEQTTDVAAIKRAYAQQSRNYHPEEDPEMFLKLRKAYQAALDYAQDNAAPDRTDVQQPEASAAPAGSESSEQGAAGQDHGTGWTIAGEETDSGPNPYLEHEARRQFLALYTGNQRKDPKSWLDYFTSSAFLEAAREPEFTALLLEDVTQRETEYPPNRGFLTWLHIAYMFWAEKVADESLPGGEGRRFQLLQGAGFDGIDSIFRIAVKGPIPKRLLGNELAMLISFTEYWRLMELAQSSGWSEQALGEASHIIDRYVLAYIQDKCVKRDWNDVERHPAGLRLLGDFFARQQLPEELYRIVWSRLSLKSAIYGRANILYGRLRELVLEHVPGIESEEVESFRQLLQDFTSYISGCRLRGGADPQADEAETDALFARGDFQRALKNRDFVKANVLNHWISMNRCDHFLLRIIAFYTEQADAPYAEQVIREAERVLRLKSIQRQLEEDRVAPAPDGFLSLSYRPFFRHWLSTGFYLAYAPESGQPLLDYLNQSFPCQPEWSRRFLSGEGGRTRPKSILIAIAGHMVEIVFFLRHMEFRLNGTPVYRPNLSWELILPGDSDVFFLLLPIAVSTYDRYEQVRTEILRRLADTAAPEADRARFAAFLAGHVCRLPVPQSREEADSLFSYLPLELFAEDEERLYGCSWDQREGVLVQFEQSMLGRRALPRGQYEQIRDEAAAVSLARRLLEEVATPSAFSLSLLPALPVEVYAHPRYAPVSPLEGEAVTRDKLEELIQQFADGKLTRLEFTWPAGSLVFVSDHAGFACFYFDRLDRTYYSMLSMPEIYRTVDHKQVQYLPFGLGKLPNYCIHHSTGSILRNLDLVFMEAGSGRKLTTAIDGRWVWSTHVDLQNKEHKYTIAKLKLGGFPMERTRNYILVSFVLSEYPVQMESETMQGEQSRVDIGKTNRSQATMALIQFMQRKLRRLRLSWKFEPADQPPYLFHIVLLQDDGRFMMACLRDDKKRAELYVADKQAYMAVEGKKYPKDTFLGRTTPAYLIHDSLNDIRCCLDLLLDDIADSAPILNQFAQFAPESPVKPRPYEAIRAELVGNI